MTKYFVEANGSKAEVIEMWESFSGWYWYITEKEDDGYAFGLVRGMETEWGSIYIPELESLKGKVWKVPKSNWSGAPLINEK